MAADLSPAALLLRSGAQRDYPLSGPAVSVGYASSNDIRVAMMGVSRRHANITFDGIDYWIEDAGSSNGTFLNGIAVVRKERLRHLDVVSLGRRAELVFVRKVVARRRTRRRGILAAWLETVDGPEAGEKREIPRGSIILGRAPSSNVVVVSQLVSKAHARIDRSGLELILTDLQSANGTYVEDKRIDSRVLKSGDEFSLGKARTYRVRTDEGEVETSEVGPSTGAESTAPGLPTTWKTRMEWTPEEKAALERVRSEAEKAAAAAKPAPKAPPKPAAAKAEPKPGEGAAPKAEPAEPKAVKPEPRPKPVEPGPAEAPPIQAKRSAKAEPESKPAAPAVPPPVQRAEAPPMKEDAAPRPAPVPPPAAAAPAPASRQESAPPVAPLPPAVAPTPAESERMSSAKTRAIPREPLPPPPAPAKAVVERRVHLDGKVQSFAVGLGDHDIGRVPQCAVRLDSPQISRRHAVLHVTPSEIAVEDLGSANGVFVNGKRISARQPLKDGDLLQFGDLAFHVREG
jgi:pSer/pThr/pTyr-binding forkhead associated (FHA) protein